METMADLKAAGWRAVEIRGTTEALESPMGRAKILVWPSGRYQVSARCRVDPYLSEAEAVARALDAEPSTPAFPSKAMAMRVIWCESCGCERPADGSEEREAPHGMGTYTICRDCVQGEPEALAYEASRAS